MSRMPWRGTALFGIVVAALAGTLWARAGVSPQDQAAASVDDETDASHSAPSDSASASATPSESASPSETASASPSAAPQTVTVTGDAVQTRFGPVQVAVTFSGDTITAVDPVQLPNGNGRDIAINSYATPILEQEVLASQSARIDTVSGATYTSEGYIDSLQSAIDKRG